MLYNVAAEHRAVDPCEVRDEATPCPRNHITEYLRNINGRVVLKTDTGTPMFLTAIFAVAKTQSTVDR